MFGGFAPRMSLKKLCFTSTSVLLFPNSNSLVSLLQHDWLDVFYFGCHKADS